MNVLFDDALLVVERTIQGRKTMTMSLSSEPKHKLEYYKDEALRLFLAAT